MGEFHEISSRLIGHEFHELENKPSFLTLESDENLKNLDFLFELENKKTEILITICVDSRQLKTKLIETRIYARGNR